MVDFTACERARGLSRRGLAQPARGRGGSIGARSAVFAMALAGCSGLLHAQAAVEPTVVEVQWGDTFSVLASRYTGELRSWRKLYDPQRSGIANPDKIKVGMRLELVSGADGTRYLRLVGQGEKAAGDTLAMQAATAPAAQPKAEPPAVKPAAPAAAATPVAPAVAAAAVAVAAAVVPAAAAVGADNTELVIGVLPNIAAPALLAQYDHLKRYLERTGQGKVRIVVPAGFKPFFDSTMRGDYDVAVAAPHFARVAQLDKGMLPIALYEPRINALLIAPTDGTVAAPRDVMGKQVGFANPTSLVAMYGLQWLSQQKIEPGKDFEVKPGRSDMGVGRMMLSGEVAAAIMSNGEMRALPVEESSRMKVVEVIARIPNFIVLAHPRLPKERVAQLRTQFKGFMMGSAEGVAFGQATGLTGIVDADEAVLKELDPYAQPTRKAMGVGN